MPTVTAAPLSGLGAILGTAEIDPGPSGGGLVLAEPPIELLGYLGGAGDLSLFTPAIAGGATVENFGSASISFGTQAIEGFVGGNAELEITDPVIEAQATSQRVGQGLVTLEGVEIRASGIQHNRATGEVIFSAPRIDAAGKQDAAGEAEIVITGILVGGSAEVGPVGECVIEVILEGEPYIDASGWIAALAQGEITLLPGFIIAAEGRRPDRFDDLILRYEDDYQI